VILAVALILPRYRTERGDTVHISRNFFGVKEVVDEEGLRKLYHGNTLHGVETQESPGEPLAYYRRSGPLGEIMTMMDGRPGQHVGVVGLGAGAIAAYAGPARRVTFFEIDPAVEEIAAGSFTFLNRCGRQCEVIIGDGRLAIGRFPEREFDLLVLDAFSSDSIPPHLLSREAMEIYLSRLKPDGAILFHVSNRYLNVKDLVSALAVDTTLPAFVRSDVATQPVPRITAQYVLVMATRNGNSLGDLASSHKWQAAVRPVGLRTWTDDYSNVIDLMRWLPPPSHE
jgi:spermidine synthase